MREWLRLAASGLVVRQALFYAVVVGSVLAAINHGDALVRGELDGERVWKIALTCLVPYAVSTLSSVKALRSAASEAQGADDAASSKPPPTLERKP